MGNKIAFIGVGNMAGAIIKGILEKKGAFERKDIILYDKLQEKMQAYDGMALAQSAPDAVKAADYVVFAVKPQNFAELLGEIKEASIDYSKKTFITIAAGIKCAFIEQYLPGAAIVRAMPNTPMLVASGVCSVCKNAFVSEECFKIAFSLFSSLGVAFELCEDKMNEIVSLTSSSPAYIFLFIKALMDGASEQGLVFESERELRKIACETVIGSARLMLQSEKTPDMLIRDVTSPGGTTAKAMDVLYGNDFEKTVKDAMLACTKRAVELSEIKD